MNTSSRIVISIATVVGIFAIGSSPPAHSFDFSGSVVSIFDGDTIDVLLNHRAERIRLPGIDYRNYSQVAPHNRVAFNSAAEAQVAGYRSAGNCS